MKTLVLMSLVVSCVAYAQDGGGIPVVAECRTEIQQVCFSPMGGCAKMWVDAINNAHHQIYLADYSLTSALIVQALIRAHGSNIIVNVMVDKSQPRIKNSQIDVLRDAEIRVLVDSSHATFHDKFMVIDDELVLTGSFNATDAAEKRNTENSIKIRDKDLAIQFEKNFRMHEDHSEYYNGKNKPMGNPL